VAGDSYMKILVFADMHGNKKALKDIILRAKKKDVDLIVNAGDFSIFGDEQEKILSKLNKIEKPILIIHGNHEDDSELRKICKKLKHCYFIHNKKFKKNNHVFIGWGGGGFSFRDRGFEKNITKFKKWSKDNKVVLVTHAPPYKTKVDKIHKEHAGCKSIRKFIESVKPELTVCGHLHECKGEDKIKGSLVINPGYKGKVVEI